MDKNPKHPLKKKKVVQKVNATAIPQAAKWQSVGFLCVLCGHVLQSRNWCQTAKMTDFQKISTHLLFSWCEIYLVVWSAVNAHFDWDCGILRFYLILLKIDKNQKNGVKIGVKLHIKGWCFYKKGYT